ncbi:MAG: hypothetical protein DMG11_02145 [Acidobacteria bacterium]|nr:MAG: hypothetical protein DMG11_02145 [Acidobacteriota bacterium]
MLFQNMNMAGMENTVGFLASGTSIEPKTTSESDPMVVKTRGSWTFMFHANAFLVDTQQSGPRGHDKLFSTNWLMPMLMHQSGRNTITFRTMLSLEPATVTDRRYPELFQKGEIAYGLPIIDGQHPHELFMELAGRYEFKLSDRSQIFVYGGPVGEPALGPTAYPHRSSASENPVATLGHHEQDSTHISNSVITLGFTGGPLQLEASTFHGREPGENRWNIDKGKPDSFASRLTIGLNKNLSGQFSIGRINSREALEPNLDTLRTTASIHYNRQFSFGHISSSLIWGRNKDLDHDRSRIFNSYALESTVKFLKRNWAWTRIENVDRDRTLLVGETRAALNIEEEPIGRVQAYTFGYERDLPIRISALNVGLGVQATAYGVPLPLKAVYGNRPAGLSVFLRLRPTGNMMEHMRQMHQH